LFISTGPAPDAGLVALAIVDNLQSHNLSVVGPFGTVRDALRAVRAKNFDIALLDIDLDREPAWPIADALMEAHIPFVFVTAYESDMVIPPRFAAVTVLSKPHKNHELLEALKGALAG
jgi:DNA-binding response OmpR family regulator